MTKKINTPELPSPFKSILPESLHMGKDRLVLRLDFYNECIVMQDFEDKGSGGGFRMVSAFDVARAMASELSFDSGLLPSNTLWWANTKSGPMAAIWVPPGMRRLTLQIDALKTKRYDVPMPGLIFLCRSGTAPRIYAAMQRPSGLKDKVFKAPLANVYNDGKTCPGSHQYSANIAEIPDDFFKSFFSRGADLNDRSKKYPADIIQMWKYLDKEQKKDYPESDLVYHATIQDVMRYRI